VSDFLDDDDHDADAAADDDDVRGSWTAEVRLCGRGGRAESGTGRHLHDGRRRRGRERRHDRDRCSQTGVQNPRTLSGRSRVHRTCQTGVAEPPWTGSAAAAV